MSDSDGQQQQSTVQDGSIVEGSNGSSSTGTEVSALLGVNTDQDAKQQETQLEDSVGLEADAKVQDRDSRRSVEEVDAGHGELNALDDGVAASAEGARSPPADDIEKQASEHLARRAAEMSINTEEVQEDRVRKDEDLPASPPAPPVPDKDAPSPNTQHEQEYDEKHPPPNDEGHIDMPEAPQGTAETTGLEIQTIMDQFQDGMNGPRSEEIMSPIMERQQPILVLPPRTSSLEHRDQAGLTPQTTGGSVRSQAVSFEGTAKPPSVSGANLDNTKSTDTESLTSIKSGSMFQPPPPSPDPDPPLPFDFQRFLEQLRHRSADPVARFLRSFLNEFGKKQWMVHEQVKIIADFLEFIAKKMAQCEVWRTVSDAEFENAREGMEKLVMNRLYSQTFSPAIAPVGGSPRKAGARGGRSAADMADPHGPGRRGQHQEDVERDEVIAQKMRIYGWLQEEHLDIKPITEKGRKFLTLAQRELLKINTYRAPRDKVICVLNTCKVIFGFLRNSKGDQSADAFVPLLIYTVIRARPEHLVSNVQYIWRFRNQDKLGGEAGYYMSSLMGVVTFIENLDRTTITITDEEFERNVEQAVSAIAEKNKAEEYEEKAHTATIAGPPLQQRLNEKSALSRPEVTPKNSMDAERSSPRRNATRDRSQHRPQGSTDTVDDFDTVTGLLRTIGKPLSTIGRIFSDEGSNTSQPSHSTRPASTPLPGSTPRSVTPNPAAPALPERRPSTDARTQEQQSTVTDAAARQASAEAAQAQRVRMQEYKVVVE